MKTDNRVIGLLALQGDYQKHRQVLDKIKVASHEVHSADDFDIIDRLIIPGGESTVIGELLKRFQIEDKFVDFIREKPVWGTCAGMIILASGVNDHRVVPYRAIDITVDRNGYGRQVYSTTTPAVFELNGFREEFDLVFIRAPRVTSVGKGVKTLLTWQGDPVLLSQNNILVSSFHPELTGSTFLHEYFAFHF